MVKLSNFTRVYLSSNAVLLNFHFAPRLLVLLGTVERSRSTCAVRGQSSRSFPGRGDSSPVLSRTESVNAGTESGLVVIFAVLLNFHFVPRSSVLLGTVKRPRNTRAVRGQSSQPFPEHGDY